MLSPEDRAALHQSFDDLYDRLNDAYWAASTIEAKDQIHGALDVITLAIDSLDHADLESDNAAIASFTQTLNASEKDLGALQKTLDQIVHNVAIATSAIQAIGKTLDIVGKVLAL